MEKISFLEFFAKYRYSDPENWNNPTSKSEIESNLLFLFLLRELNNETKPNHYEEDESLEMILEPEIILNESTSSTASTSGTNNGNSSKQEDLKPPDNTVETEEQFHAKTEVSIPITIRNSIYLFLTITISRKKYYSYFSLVCRKCLSNHLQRPKIRKKTIIILNHPQVVQLPHPVQIMEIAKTTRIPIMKMIWLINKDSI